MEFTATLQLAGKTATGIRVPDDVIEALSFSNRKRHVLAVDSAKTAETRTRRIAKIISELS